MINSPLSPPYLKFIPPPPPPFFECMGIISIFLCHKYARSGLITFMSYNLKSKFVYLNFTPRFTIQQGRFCQFVNIKNSII